MSSAVNLTDIFFKFFLLLVSITSLCLLKEAHCLVISLGDSTVLIIFLLASLALFLLIPAGLLAFILNATLPKK